MSSSRRALATPALVVLLGALTACGGGSSTEAGTPTPSASPSASASVEASPEPTALDAADFIRTIVDAQVAAGSYDFAMTMGSQGESMSMSGSVHLGGDTPALSMAIEAPDTPAMTVRSVDGMSYVNLGDLTGGKFLAIDPADESNPFGAAFADAMGEIDPTMGLEGQEAAIVSVTPTGEPTEVDGVQAQTYVVVVDPSKLPEEMAELESQLPPGTEMPETLEYTYVVDAEGRAREVSFDILGIQSRMTFTNWGTAAPVEAPTAEEISTEDPFAG